VCHARGDGISNGCLFIEACAAMIYLFGFLREKNAQKNSLLQ
jgi:hypothetical protein